MKYILVLFLALAACTFDSDKATITFGQKDGVAADSITNSQWSEQRQLPCNHCAITEKWHRGHLYIFSEYGTVIHAEHCPAPKHICQP